MCSSINALDKSADPLNHWHFPVSWSYEGRNRIDISAEVFTSPISFFRHWWEQTCYYPRDLFHTWPLLTNYILANPQFPKHTYTSVKWIENKNVHLLLIAVRVQKTNYKTARCEKNVKVCALESTVLPRLLYTGSFIKFYRGEFLTI